MRRYQNTLTFNIRENFRFLYDDEYEIWLHVFSEVLRKDISHEAWFHSLLATNLTQLSWMMKVNPFRDSKNYKKTRTCFWHYAVLTKTRSQMTTVILFSLQNDTGSRMRTLSLLGKNSYQNLTVTNISTRTETLSEMNLLKCKHTSEWGNTIRNLLRLCHALETQHTVKIPATAGSSVHF